MKRQTLPFPDVSQERYLMKEERLCVAGKETVYRLYERRCTRAQYEVEISMETEAELLPVGQDFPLAARIYSALVRGEVTLCTFRNVVDDCLM